MSDDMRVLTAAWAALRGAIGTVARRVRYVRVREVTEGTDGAGHVHYHVVTWWPWVDYAWLRAAWVRAVERAGGETSQLDARVSRPRKTTARGATDAAAAYVASGSAAAYVAAGDAPLPDHVRVRMYAACRGRRQVTTSVGLIRRVPAHCEPCGGWVWDVTPARAAYVAPSHPVRVLARGDPWPIDSAREAEHRHAVRELRTLRRAVADGYRPYDFEMLIDFVRPSSM